MRSLFFSFIILSGPIILLYGQNNAFSLDSIDIEEVVIMSTRANANDPVTIQNISLQKIENIYSGQDPSVLLQQLSPSIISYSDAGTDIGNYAQFRMRGISQSRINITLNGVPLNDMVDQGVYFSNFSDFGNSIESIQVQRGVGASNAGVASYGGSVNFESTNIFNEDANTELQFTTGSFGTLRTSAEVQTGKLDNGIGAYARMTRTNVNGYKHHSSSDSYSFFGSIGLLGEKDVWKITGLMGKTENDQAYLPVLLKDINREPATNYNHPNDTDDFEQELIQLQYSRYLAPSTKFDATIYYGGARGVFPFAIDDKTQFVYGLSNNHYGMLSHLTFEKNNFIVKSGLQAYKFDRTNFEYLAPNVSNPYDRDHTNKNEVSVFSKLEYKLNDFSIYGDVNLRSVSMKLHKDKELGTGIESDKQWTFFNFVGGVNYKFNNAQSAYISYGKTGREPTRSDIRNGALFGEYVFDLELGWRLRTRQGKLNINLFHMDFNNEITQVGALMERSYIEVRKNVPYSRRSGLELEFEYQLSGRYQFSFNGAYMTSNVDEFTNGTEVLKNVSHIFSPKWVMRPQVDFNISDKLNFGLSGRHVSSSYMELANISSFRLPAHTVLNTQIRLDFNKFVTVNLQVNNILNTRYFTDGAPVDLDFDGSVEGPGYRIQPLRHFYVMCTLRL